MDKLYINIRNRRKELGMNQEALAAKMGYTNRSSIAKIENGSVDIPQSKIIQFAKVLETTPGDLMGVVEYKELSDKTKPTPSVRIPVFSHVAAGIPIDAIEDVVDWEEIPEDMSRTGEYFGLKVKGDSMQPRIAEGDTVIVHQQSDAESGEVVIVRINGDYATCKRLAKYAGGISLISFNPLYEPINFTEKEIREIPVEIIGKVVENRQKY